MSDNSLANDLAEKLVVKLKEDGALDLTDTKAFRDFTSLLHEAITKNETELTNYIGMLGGLRNDLDAIKEQDKNTLESIKNQNATISDEIKNIVQYVADYVSNGNKANEQANAQTKEAQAKKQSTKQAAPTENVAPKSNVEEKPNVEEKVKEELETKEENISDSKIKETLDSVNQRSLKILKAINEFAKDTKKETKETEQTIKHEVKQSEKKINLKHKVQMWRSERKLKHTIKSRFGKWWSRIKKLMFVASIFFFGPFLGKLLSGVKEMTEPIWRPFWNWFEDEFPKITTFLGEITESVKTIADFVKPIVDYFAEEKNENIETDITPEIANDVKAAIIQNVESQNVTKEIPNEVTPDFVASEGYKAVPEISDMMAVYGSTPIVKEKYKEIEEVLIKKKETTTDPLELQDIDASLKKIALYKAQIEKEESKLIPNWISPKNITDVTNSEGFKGIREFEAKRQLKQSEKELIKLQNASNSNNGANESLLSNSVALSNVVKNDVKQDSTINIVENTNVNTTEIHITTDSKKPWQ